MLRHLITGTRQMRKVQRGFTLVELLVVVAIIVALAAASIVAVSKFSGKGQEGATVAELNAVQTAMDTMMADKGITAVTASASGAPITGAGFASVPTEAGAGGLAAYLRTTATYTYCWTTTGKVTQTAANCP